MLDTTHKSSLSEAKHDLKPVVYKFLTSTSVKGVGRVLNSGDWCLKGLWLLTVLFGAGMALYFLSKLFVVYLSKATTTSVSETQGNVPFPDITVCNLNTIANVPNIMKKLKQYESMMKMVMTDADWTIADPILLSYLLEPTALFQNMDMDSVIMNNFNTSFIVDCNWHGQSSSTIADPDVRIYCKENLKVSLFSPEYGLCFTFSPKALPSDIMGYTGIFYLDNFMKWSMPYFRMSLSEPFATGVRLAVHEAGTVPVMSTGINIASGLHTTIRIQVTKRKMLPPPYSTCFVNNTWPSSFGIFNYSRSACSELCIQDITIKECSCISGYLLSLQTMRTHHRFCQQIGNGSTHDELVALNKRLQCAMDIRYSTNCSERCHMPCNEDRYQLRAFNAPWPHPAYIVALYRTYIKGQPYDSKFADIEEMAHMMNQLDHAEELLNEYDVGLMSNLELNNSFSESMMNMTIDQSFIDNHKTDLFQKIKVNNLIKDNFLQIIVIFDSDIITSLIDKPAVTIESLIGSMGGTLNLWIGISFVTIVEVIEVIFSLCRLVVYAIKEKKDKNRLNKSKVEPIEMKLQ